MTAEAEGRPFRPPPPSSVQTVSKKQDNDFDDWGSWDSTKEKKAPVKVLSKYEMHRGRSC